MSELAGASFLHERNPNLHTSREVEDVATFLRVAGENIPNDPSAKIFEYLGFLSNQNYANDGIINGDRESIARQVDHAVIQADSVPESYFDLQRRIAREQGLGDIEIYDDMRSELISTIISDQKASLKKWADYLSRGEANYPAWFKLYAFDSVKKLAPLDVEKVVFPKRSKSTVSTFPDLNREALALVYDYLNKSRVLGQPNQVANQEARQLVGGGNFAALYAYALKIVTHEASEQLGSLNGEWVKFDQIPDKYRASYVQDADGEFYDPNAHSITNETALKLARSIQDHGTGWCTAGESTAANQLSMGDFYVFYTEDKDGNQTIPRVAIRTEFGVVKEVRGIMANQELEPAMYEITEQKLKQLKGGDVFFQRLADMKLLTSIETKHKAGHSLTKDELLFLYEISRPIYGFGEIDGDSPERDPRVYEIQAQRRFMEDFRVMADMPLDDQAAQKLFESGQFGLFIRFAKELPRIDATILTNIAFRQELRPMIEDRYGTDEDDSADAAIANLIASCLPAVSGRLDSNVAKLLIRYESVTVYNIDREHQLHPKISNVARDYFDKFTEDAKEIIGNADLKVWQTWQIADALASLRQVDVEAARRLLKAGEDDAIKEHFHSFDKEARKFIKRAFKDPDFEI